MVSRRTQAELQAFFAPGQAAGMITPDRVQDAIFTLRPAYARLSVTSPATTNITGQNVWTKLAGTTALGVGALGFSMPQNNRLVCDVEQPCIVTVTAAVSLTNGSNVNADVGIAIDGEIRESSIQAIRIPSGGGAAEGVILADFEGVQGDYFEVWARNTTSDSDITAARLVLRAQGFVL